ncbi:MAG: protein kinase, partial [Deltaproteobacteria bacterium]|nr:protein kinase [Deltaproteobacteria bacterium]
MAASHSTCPFELRELLGEGGHGKVYLAFDRRNQSLAALKFLSEGSEGLGLFRFKEEVAVLAQLSHPNLVKIEDFFLDHPWKGELPAGPFYAMEYLKGKTLAQTPADSPERILEIFGQACLGLNYLHGKGLVHRDLKPENLMVISDGQVKILDFGLSKQGGTNRGVSGTLRYLPPESWSGDYDAKSDLYALGAVFQEWMGEKNRPDLPKYFSTLMARLLQENPSRRPASARTLLQYLNEHGSKKWPLAEAEFNPASLQKLPLQGRDALLQEYTEQLQHPSPGRNLIEIHGPTGVGRSRLLDEMKWVAQLEGIHFQAVRPETSPHWFSDLATLLEMPQLSGHFSYENLLQLFRKIRPQGLVLAFSDLHLWPEAPLRQLKLFLGGLQRGPENLTVILEFNSDWNSEALQDLLSYRENWAKRLDWELQDLPALETASLLHLALGENKIPKEVEAQILQNCSGRPLLLMESLRHYFSRGKDEEKSELPHSLQEALKFRIKALPSPAKTLLALVAVEEEESDAEELRALWNDESVSFVEAEKDLLQAGFIRRESTVGNLLALRHPVLRQDLLRALSSGTANEAHRARFGFLSKKLETPTKPSRLLLRLVLHAAELGDIPAMEIYGLKAVEFLAGGAETLRALDLAKRLLSFPLSPQNRCALHAHRAPLFYLLGRFQEALEAYDAWYELREDDATHLQKLKHRFYRGLVHFTAGNGSVAESSLEEALEISGGNPPKAHAFYLIRARNLLSSLLERKGNLAQANLQLQKALQLEADSPLVAGEIHQRLGEIAERSLDFAEAENQLGQAEKLFQESGFSQSKAIANHAQAILALAQGRLAEASKKMESALAHAKEGGDILQWARYLENRGVLRKKIGNYGAAMEDFREAEPLIRAVGGIEDHLLLDLHRASLYHNLGNRALGDRFMEALIRRGPDLKRYGLQSSLALLLADRFLATGNFEEAEELFASVAGDAANPPSLRLTGQLGIARIACQATKKNSDFTPILDALAGLEDPSFQIWRNLFSLKSLSTEQWTTELLLSLVENSERLENVETKIETSLILARVFEREEFPELSREFSSRAAESWKKIYLNLTEELKMSFDEKRILQAMKDSSDQNAAITPSEAAGPAPTVAKSETKGQLTDERFRQFCSISRQILQKKDLQEILDRIMEAAIELTGAERGFLILKPLERSESFQSFFEDYEIRCARNLNKNAIPSQDAQISKNALKEAIGQGSYLLTDNAQLDPRLQSKKSVVQYQLNAILVVPMGTEEETLGAIYLDHRYQPGCFKENDVSLLTALAAQAAIAIEKAQMLESLKIAKQSLEKEVVEKEQRIEMLSDKLQRSRDDLRFEYTEIIGGSPAILRVFQLLDHITETSVPIWIFGESGTGKELVAKALHYNSPRKKGAFIAENVSAIPETLL